MINKSAAPKNLLSRDQDLPVTADLLLQKLDELEISYDLYEHAPVFSVEESTPLKASIPGVHCRNLFLRDKKKQMFLFTAANETAVDLKKLPALLECGRLSFGSADRLWQYLGVKPGSVCPFAVINDKEQNVTLVLDKDMMAADIVTYHPMENHLTIGLKPEDLIKFARASGHEPLIIDLQEAAPE